MGKPDLRGRDLFDLSDEELDEIAAAAARDAVERAFAAGIPVTGMEGGVLKRWYPDGRVEVFAEHEHASVDEGHPVVRRAVYV